MHVCVCAHTHTHTLCSKSPLSALDTKPRNVFLCALHYFFLQSANFLMSLAHLRNACLGLPWWLSGKEATCQSRRHRFDHWWRKISYAVEQLSLCTTTIELVLSSPRAETLSPQAAVTEDHAPRARAPKQENPLQWEAHGPQPESSPAHSNQRKGLCSNKDRARPSK